MTAGDAGSTIPLVLFVCPHNAGRSQIAAVLLDAYAGGRARAVSAGVEPVAALNIAVVAAMREAGYSMEGLAPRMLRDEDIDEADRVVTIGCSGHPGFPAELSEEDWDVEDPAGGPMPRVRQVRDDIARRVRALLREMGIEPVR